MARLADGPALRTISVLGVAERMRREATQWLNHWSTPRHAIVCVPTSPATFHVARYDLDSLEALENKLAQLPAGTEFRWTATGPEISGEQKESLVSKTAS
jgi:hypothetical protein